MGIILPASAQKLKRIVPPFLVEYCKLFLGSGITFRGVFGSWNEAARNAEGYDAEQILQKVRTATLKVVHGQAACERDSVVFDKPTFPFPLIAVLLRAAQERRGKLVVLDFGGALGSTYYQCRDFLGGMESLRWHVVEQPKFAVCGRHEFQNEMLRFYESVQSCVADGRPDVVLMSGVLQYLPDPAQVLGMVVGVRASFLVIDRTPIAVSGRQVISVQHVPAAITRSSYPLWLFNEEQLKAPLSGEYEELASFDAVDGELGHGRLKARFKGFIFKRKHTSA